MTTEENFVDFQCPHCSQPASFPESAVGSAQVCPACEDVVIVPPAGTATGLLVPLPIITSRLRLRRFTGSDWKALRDLVADDAGFVYVDGLPPAADEVTIANWLEADQHIRLTTPNEIFRLAIELQEGSRVIGFLGLWFTDIQRLQAGFNLSLHRSYQRQGLGLEAVDGLLGFCFKGIRLHRVSVRCDSRNAAACRLFEKVGLRREGEFVKDQRTPDGQWTNTVVFAALEEEFGPDKPGATT